MLHLHTSGRIEPLAAALAAALSDAPSDPMSPEWIAVPSEGMRRWLSLELARHLGASGPSSHDGVAANIESAFPGTLRARVLDAARPVDAHGALDPDPWRVERLVWSVLDTAALHADDPRLAPLIELPPGGSKFGRARRVADLFDRYHVHRPGMVLGWAKGLDVDATGRQIAAHHAWQPHLWRLVRAHLDTPSPAEQLPDLLERVRSGDLELDLPERVAFFGLTLLPGGAGFLDLAAAVGARRDLHVFLLEPSAAASERIVGTLAPASGSSPRTRAEDSTAAAVHHPLLRSWGRLHRETTVLLADGTARGLPEPERVRATSLGRSRSAKGPATLLTRLQADITADTAPSGDLTPDPTDRSVQFHACHGPTRQVEVLRDVLLHLLADEDLALVEDDILVVCPALERFAPTIDAVFGPSSDDTSSAALPATPRRAASPVAGDAGQDDLPGLRYRIADRSIRSSNPVLTAASALLDLVGGRFDAPGVLDLIALGPVRERYRFSDDDLARISEWVGSTNVRWGLDAAQREASGVPASIVNNTWRAATDRLLVGAAVYDDDRTLAIGDVAPYGIESDDVVVAGRLADLMWRLGQLAEESGTARPVADWVDLLRDACSTLFSTSRDTEWQFEALLKVLADIVESAQTPAGQSEVPLEFIDLRRLLADRLAGAPGRPDFFRGGITISSMTPLRWVPHRVVVLLGVDQSAFGAGAVDGDDLAANTPLLGDRDTRAEARQSLLEAVLAAGERLVLLRDGHDVRTNHEVPAAVAVAELRDALVAMVAPDDRPGFAERLELHHPRQAFDDRCFVPGELVDGQPWSFDSTALAGARARRSRADALRPFLETPFEPDDSTVIELATLHAFLKDPVKFFLQRRLGLRLPRSEDAVSSLLPVDLGGLEKWKVGDSLLNARLNGATVDEWERVERRLGTLPPAALGDKLLSDVVVFVENLVDTAASRGLVAGPGEGLPVDVRLPDGTRVVGSVLGRLGPDTPGPVRVSYSRNRPAFRVLAWLDLMALTATDASVDHRALGVYRGPTDAKPPEAVDLVAVGNSVDARRATALGALQVVVDLFRRGTAEPLPLFGAVSPMVYVGEAAPHHWSRNADYGGGGDGDDLANWIVYGSVHDFDSLMSLRAHDSDPEPLFPDGGGRVERFANYLWHTIQSTAADRPTGVDAGQAPTDESDGAVS